MPLAFLVTGCDHLLIMRSNLFSLLRRQLSRPICSVATLTLMLAALFVLCAPADAQRIVLQTASAATRGTMTDAGVVPSSQRLTLTLTLAPDAGRVTALDSFLAGLTDPASLSFHQWVTPVQFAADFGATPAQLAVASTWLESQGLGVDAVSPSRTRISVSGFAAQIESAFAVSLRQYQVRGALYFSNAAQPSLPAGVASFFTSIDGLDNLPAGNVALTIAALASVVDANATGVLPLDASTSITDTSAAHAAALSSLFRQAAAQGITALVLRAGNAQAGFAEVTSIALPGDAADVSSAIAARPTWQVAPGLPADALRHTPDLTTASLAQFAQSIQSLAVQTTGSRLGNINATLYRLAPTQGLYTQPDAATPGTWEPATGLGLIDPIAFVKAYPRGTGMSFTSFSSTNYTPTHGQGTSFTSNVTSGTGGPVPTGTVIFTANGTTLGVVALVAGSATYSTNVLDGGNYTIQVLYSGDAVYASSTSSTASIYVKPEPAILGVTVSGGAVVGGTFTVIVTDKAGSGIGRPTGAVTVTLPVNGSTYSGTLAPASANSSTATVIIPASTVGTLTLSIACSSSVSFDCTNPYTTTVTISKATPTLTINYTPSPAVSGQSITLNATVTGVGTAPIPSGNVQFFDNGTTLNAGALSNGATTTTGVVPTTPTHVITATYQGDPNYNVVSTTANSTTSGPISTTLTLSTSSTVVTPGQAITFTAVVIPASTGSASPGGTVQFFDGTTLLGTGTVSNNVATFSTATLSGASDHSITAIYVGDTNYTGSSSPVITVSKTVRPIATTVSLSASSTTFTTGQPITFTATLTPASVGAAAPTGTVQFFDGAVPLGTATIAGGAASFATTGLTGTTAHAITATYSGDTLYAASSSPVLTVGKNTSTAATSTTLTALPAIAPVGAAVVLTAIVTPTLNNVPPTGTVQFTNGGAVLCNVALTGSTATCSVTTFPVGNTSVVANYLGDSSYAASTSNSAVVSMTASSATLSASISPAVAPAGGIATVTATLVAANGTVPTGTITATVLGVTGGIYNVTLPGTVNTSTVTVMIPINAPAVAGTYNVVVSCAGSNFTCSPVTLSLVSSGSTTGKIATATVLASTPAIFMAGTAVSLTATVTPVSAGTSGPAGTMLFFDGTTQIGSVPVTAGTVTGTAIATLPVTLSAATTHSVTAVYSGDTSYATSTSPALTGNGAGGAVGAAITLTSNATSGSAGTSIAFTATVTGTTALGVGPTGKVSFFLAGATPTLLGTVALSPAAPGFAVATLSTSTLAPGSQTIFAIYAGDVNFTTVTSNNIVIGVFDYTLSFSPQNLSLTRGQTGFVSVTGVAFSKFTGSISLSCTPPANIEILCSFSPTTLFGSGTTILKVTTTSPHTAALIPVRPLGQGLGGGVGAISLAGLVCLLLPASRRRLPGLLLVLLALGLTMNLGCSAGNLNSPAVINAQGTPLGTAILTITTSGTDGVNSIHHTYPFQVTVQ